MMISAYFRVIGPTILGLSILISGCKSTKNHKTSTDVIIDSLQELVIDGSDEPYRASSTRINDLIHTRLEVSFDWEKAQLPGTAILDFKPYFYPTKSLELDAKGMEILDVALKTANGKQGLSYKYDSLKLTVALDREYKRFESYTVVINYIAKPEELKKGGSDAITDDKGLYFINRLGIEKNKPKQLWTQGETESSSCWFPTIDKPNERMTQEIFITVDTAFITLSNGLLQFSSENPNGTRTDCWKQSLPAAPYLTMMAVGKWKIIKDKWRDKEVNYYMEPEFAPYTKNIFGKTPDMLEFFSNRLGVDYPWEKYSQVIVRDYVSGAMENTTAVVHGDFFNQTAREMLDGDNESTVAHELFHHWFGDLVTCESWSNLPLNESFATYGEYLWLEKAYGRDEADYHGQTDLRRYLSESAQKKEDLIRFFYSDKEDMFDMHSYAKGGRVLNMLRRYLGDDAFFEGLKVYLNENKFQSVEIHNLRLAMEKVSGEDLNWFFNQWFLNKGHPVLSIETNFDSLNLRQNVVITQMQEKGENPLYKIPLDVDIYYPNGKERQRIWITKRTEIISINVKEKPVWVNVDAEKQLLGVKIEKKTKEEWIWQLKQGPLFLDKYEAIAQIAPYSSEPEVADLLIKATKDSHFAIRSLALKTLTIKSFADQEEHKSLLRNMAQNDPKSSVRATAIRKMEPYASVQTLPFLKDIAQNDLSYQVIGEALSSTNAIDSKEGIEMARKLASEAKGSLLLNIAIILADKGAESDSDFFKNGFAKVSDNNAKYTFTALIGRYLSNQDLELQSKMLPMLEGIARNESAWYIRLAAIQGLNEISLKIQNRISELKKSTAANSSDTAVIDRLNQQQKAIDELLADIKSKENDPKVKRIIGG